MGKIERIQLAPGDRERLERLVRNRNTPRKVVWRARIVLAGNGIGAVAVARQVGKSVPTVRRWRRLGVFNSVADLEKAIMDYLEQHNANPKPFVWTASAGAILEKVARPKQALESV